MTEVSSLVVSDPLAIGAENAGIDVAGDGDIAFCPWPAYLEHTFEQTVQVYDFNLWTYATQSVRNNEYQITRMKEGFTDFFSQFPNDLRYYLKSGDVIVTLFGENFPIVEKKFGQSGERVNTHDWLYDLGILDGWNIVQNDTPEVTVDSEPVEQYFHSVGNHEVFEINHDLVKNPEILAVNPASGLPAGIAINEILDIHQDPIQTDGTLIILPQPTSVSKPLEIMSTLVELGWVYHPDRRPQTVVPEIPEDKTSLSIPMSELDDELIKVSWSKYARGEYRDAASRACQHLEHRVRKLLEDEHSGRDGASLMKHAFSKHSGPLSMGERAGEREGVMHLYAGAIQGIWNPLHHRPTASDADKYLDEFGQQEAHDVISFINFLLGLLPEDTDSSPTNSEAE
jgi:hypothetical protein